MIDDALSLFKNIPAYETGRLLFRQMCGEDSADMYEYASDPRVSAYLLWSPHESPAYTRSYLSYLQKAYRRGEFYDWAVIEKASGKMIGTGGFSRIEPKNDLAEIGYVLSAAHWGRGYGSEIASFLLSFGFTVLRCERIEARYMTENTASHHVMEKCGMRFEGVLRKSLLVKGAYRDVGICAILREEYEEREERRRNEEAKKRKGFSEKKGDGGREAVTGKGILGAVSAAPSLRPRWYDRLRKNHGG